MVFEFGVAAAFRGSEARLFGEKGEWMNRRYHETFPWFRELSVAAAFQTMEKQVSNPI